MRVDLLDFDLPPALIAQRPLADRDGARLLHLPPGGGGLEDRLVLDLPELLPAGSLVVVNDTRVLPARLLGHRRPTGGAVELLLLERLSGPAERWACMGRSSKPLRPGTQLVFGDTIEAEVEAREDDGLVVARLSTTSGEALEDALRREGHMPLPPYVERDDDESDRERYQTVFASKDGAVAAPTAGLHLSWPLIERLKARGCEVASVTLHVGIGTFRPVKVERLSEHTMHEEWCDVPQATVDAVAAARARGAPVVAVGTTVVRALESAAASGALVAGSRRTRLLIMPGHEFRVVDRLFTNFHLPRSTLLALVAAFGGLERVLAAYRHAVASGYRFFSYGDAMLLSERAR